MITMQNVCKTYKVSKRDARFSSAFKALFHKEYELIHALDGVSFTISDGEMVGYIGPNGAGKSSTIKILSGILTPEEGTCLINGLTPWKNRIEHVKNIGVVFGQRTQLWWDVPVMDSFELLKEIYRSTITFTAAIWNSSVKCWAFRSFFGRPPGSYLWDSGCGARLPPPFFTTPKSCFWTSLP